MWVLAELKKSYDYLCSVREYGIEENHIDNLGETIRNKDNIEMLDETIRSVAKIYHNVYKNLDREKLRYEGAERKIDERVYISSDINYDYEYYNRDTDEKDFCTCDDIDCYWYEDLMLI